MWATGCLFFQASFLASKFHFFLFFKAFKRKILDIHKFPDFFNKNSLIQNSDLIISSPPPSPVVGESMPGSTQNVLPRLEVSLVLELLPGTAGGRVQRGSGYADSQCASRPSQEMA